MTVFLLLAFWLAQQPKQPPVHNITGTVTNAITGEPIQRALVQIWGGSNKSALTGADGRFQISDVPEGMLNCQVTKPGFFSPQNIPGKQSDPCKIGADSNELHLTLFPASKIAGRITDENGDPVADIPLQVLAESIFNGRKQWAMRGSTTTDEDGGYRTDDLTPSRYVVFAAGHVLPDGEQDGAAEVFGPAYYPDAGDLISAQALDLQPGEEFRADFHVRASRGYRVSGTVENYPANNGVSFSIRDISGQTMWWPVNFDAKRGQFVIRGLPPGAWMLSVMANDQGHTYEATQELAVGQSDINNLRVRLHAAITIPLIVNRPGETGMRFVNANLISVDQSRPQQQQYGATMRDQKSSQSFENVMPGKYRLSVPSLPNQCVESAWYGSVDLLRDHLVISPEAGAQPITVNLTSDCATLTATVTNSEQHSFGVLLIVPASGNQDPLVWTIGVPTGMAPGAYRNNRIILAPGTYQVYAFTDVNQLEYANPDVLKQYSSQTVEVSAGQTTEISIAITDPKAK